MDEVFSLHSFQSYSLPYGQFFDTKLDLGLLGTTFVAYDFLSSAFLSSVGVLAPAEF